MTFRDTRTFGVLLVALAVGVSVGAVPIGATAGAVATEPDDPTEATEPTPVSSCVTIDEPGTYVLTGDIENGGKTPISGSCIEITADDVTFDGSGYDVGGRGVSHTDGVAVVGAENVTVQNFEVHDWHNGIAVENGSVSVHDVKTYANAYGIRLVNASDSTVSNNTVEDNLVGISADGGDVSLADNTLSGNEIPVRGDGWTASMRAEF